MWCTHINAGPITKMPWYKKTSKSSSHKKPSDHTNHKTPWYKKLLIGQSQKKTLSTMNYAELLDAKNKSLAKKDHFTTIKYLERMAKICDDLEIMREILMELADLLFEDKKFTKASLLYDQYTKSYPGRRKEYEKALYKKMLCTFYQTLYHDRDQTMTEKTIELCDTFLKECPGSNYEQDVKSTRNSCNRKCARHELYITEHYIKQNRIPSATRRIAKIKENYELIPEIEPAVLTLEITLADKIGNTQYAQEKRTELSEKYPNLQNTLVEQNKRTFNMARRF